MVENQDQSAELPLEGAGAQLARARVAAGQSLTDIAQITRISERQLSAIEAGNFAALPSRAYAVGFSRTYAKAVGLDSNAIVALVREELAAQDNDHGRHALPAFEPGDPARLPGRRVAWYAALGLVLVLVAGFLVWPSLYAPGGSLPSILPRETPRPAPTQSAAPAAQPTGPVVFTATRDRVWVRFADGSGQQLLQKELALGESWTLPEGVVAATLTTARPDGLAVTIGGRPVPPLATTEQLMRDVPVTAAALLARGTQPAAAPVVSTAPVSSPAPVARRRQPTAAVPAPGETASAFATPAAAPQPGPGGNAAAVTADSQG